MAMARRLRGVAEHLITAPASSAALRLHTTDDELLQHSSPTDAMPPRLLTDEQVKAFVQMGYLQLPITELSPEFHASVHEKATLLNGPHGQACLHNNIYPAIPELGTVMRSPTVRGALQSVLGADYVMHACRAFHNSDGRDSDQNFHKDGLEGHGPVRHHRPRWAMVMYVPLGSSLQMGPTAILPGSQYLSSTGEEWAAVNESHPPNSNEDYVQRGQSVTYDENKALSPELEDTDICFPPGQGSAYLIHFDMLHKGTARLLEDLGHPTRQMFKFQYFRVSSPAPNSPSWNHSGAPDPVQGAFAETAAPDRLQQIWQATWDWMKGLSMTPPPVLQKRTLTILSDRTEMLYATGPSSESKRVGAAYGLGRAAMAGCTQSLKVLLEAVQADGDVNERKPSLALWGTDTQRAAMHGLSTSGDAGAAAMLPYLLDSGMSPTVLAAMATALGEAVLNPTEDMVRAYGATMTRLRHEILEHEIDHTIRLAPTAVVKLERHRGTAFCTAEFKKQYMQPRWQALAAAAVGLWHLAQRAVATDNREVCVAAVEAAAPFTGTGVELGPQCRQNATGALLTLSSVSSDMPVTTRQRLLDCLAGLAKDDDRYVRAAALQALARIGRASSLSERAMLRPRLRAIDGVVSTLVEQRWCPISGLAGFSAGASF